ncbi:hypothetical protein TIFTF001_045432 [Ficus carica]|uniref:Uncharacterized protein n=1 Tax=Ficus carica TaxID=3494 RepID=A0AA87YXZ3_FICCA|nr:hypothetical protein TIFTF001_045432 [Ficus carica]
MGGFDLRILIPIFINLLKSHSRALPRDWDAFGVLSSNEIPWINISFHVCLLLLFSFTSITLALPHPNYSPNTAVLLRFRFGNFSPHIAVSLVCSFVFPQALFWFMYPAILVLIPFLRWLNVKLSALPVWNLHINSTLTRREQTNNVHVELSHQVPIPEVNVAISPKNST